MKKLITLLVLILGLSIHSSAFAATKTNTIHYHYKQMYLTLPHTIHTSYNFKAILAHPRTNKIINHIKVSKSYKTPKYHIVKASKITYHKEIKAPTYHYHPVKFKTIKITHVSYHSTFHPAKIKTISFHRHKI
jgi:hypothetical protein